MSLYHQIFIKRTFDTPEKIGVLNKYMYSVQIPIQIPIQIPLQIQIQIPLQIPLQIPIQIPIQTSVRVKEGARGNLGSPQDTLFWSLYISNYGQTKYESIGRGYSNVEISEKQKIVEFIKKVPNIVKTKVMLQEIMSDLMTNARITPSLLPAFAAFYKKRLIITKCSKFFIEICPPDTIDIQTVHLIKNDKGNYGIDYTPPNLDKLIRLEQCAF